MSAWRRRAIELFPEYRDEFSDPNWSVYSVFHELMPRCRAAHAAGDEVALKKIYAFANWCAEQSAKDLWNAAGVAFFEHLAESPKIVEEFPKWVPKHVFEEVASLVEGKIGAKQMAVIRKKYTPPL